MSDVSFIHEKAAATAFDEQALVFDSLYRDGKIIQYKRKRVRDHLMTFIPPGSHILELNAGTGEDAIFLAEHGHTVHATDISANMQKGMIEKVKKKKLEDNITYEKCSFTSLDGLSARGPYDHIFSNFAGLNCTPDLEKVLASLEPLLKPRAFVTLVILPKFCLWEFIMLFRGRFRTAFRRFAGNNGARAHIEGHYFRCWYYNPSFVIKKLKQDYNVLSLEGLCTIAPPSYLEGFAEKYPAAWNLLSKSEDKWKSRWPWRVMGDYYIITLQKAR